MQNSNEYDEISLRELIETLMRGKLLIGLIAVIALVLSLSVSLYMKNADKSVKQVVAINFDGADSGINPDGTPFDINFLRSSVVINSALEELAISGEVNINDLRSSIEVAPIIPGNIADIIEQRRKSGEDYKYYPSEYVVYLNSYRKLGISDEMGKSILEEVIAQYYEYFNDKYSENIMLSDVVGSADYDTYDYSEISSIIHKQVAIIDNYLEARINTAGEFRSSRTGLSFGDMKESLDIINQVELGKFDSIVSVYKLTRSKNNLITNYQYMIEQNQLQQAKKMSESDVALDMMVKYDKTKDNLLIPGVSEETVEISGNSYYDELAKMATEAAIEAKNTGHDIAYIREEINKLENDGYSDEVKNQAVLEADDMLKKVTIKIDNLINVINETSKEYHDKKMANSITKLSPAQIYSDVNLKLNLAIGLVLGLMIGVFVVFFREYWRNSH